MKKSIEEMVVKIISAINNDIRNVHGAEGYSVLKMILSAYNDYQESERDGVDYIFNVENTNDLKRCIDGGMTAKEICVLYSGSQAYHLRYFYFGCNYPTPKPIANWHHNDRMNAKMCRAFAEFMEQPCRSPRYKNNYELAVEMWNLNNSDTYIQIKEDSNGNVIMPNYRKII